MLLLVYPLSYLALHVHIPLEHIIEIILSPNVENPDVYLSMIASYEYVLVA